MFDSVIKLAWSAFSICSRRNKQSNNIYPDQTAPLGAVWSGYYVFASVIKLVCSAFRYMQQIYNKQS